jgi:hypothetical protein
MDSPLLAIATKPVTTIPDVIASLEAIDALLPVTDGLKWFNWLYLIVTKAVDLNIGANTFHNPAWLTQLDVVFAGLYFSALADWLTPGETAPKCWSTFFNARNDAKLARVQFALAGINAHIDHDLSEAIVETCRQFGITPVHQSPEYLDYTQVNNILNPIVDQAKTQLLTGLLGDDLPSIDYVENMVAAFGLRTSREAAWTNGEILFHIEAIPGLGKRFLTGLDNAAARAAHGLLAPVGV